MRVLTDSLARAVFAPAEFEPEPQGLPEAPGLAESQVRSPEQKASQGQNWAPERFPVSQALRELPGEQALRGAELRREASDVPRAVRPSLGELAAWAGR